MRLGEPMEVTLIDPKCAFGWIDENTLCGASRTSPGNVTKVLLEGFSSEVGQNLEVGTFPHLGRFLQPAPEPLVGDIDIFDTYPGKKWLLYLGRMEGSNAHCACGLQLLDLGTRERILLLDCSVGKGPFPRWAKFSPQGGKLAAAVQVWEESKVKRKIFVYEVLDMGVE